MTEPSAIPSPPLPTRQAIADAVTGLGWRNVLGLLRTSVRVGSLAQAVEVAATVVGSAADVDNRLWVDIRRDRVTLSLQTHAVAATTARDVDLARIVSAAVGELGLRTDAEVGGEPRSVQVLEFAIDALDIPSIRLFWKAVLGYVDEPGSSGPEDPLVDPLGHGPALWFQQMDAPRPQRNRIHLDVSVPHDEAESRIRAALDAGGTVRSDAAAPAFWVLADAEGNEVCITTWQGRDAPS
ncbi:MAG TPA: VOC family protein [Actinopolymorphaceae bacterium]|nr:VOC family protein [Actinopolymorphaceae bacterium]